MSRIYEIAHPSSSRSYSVSDVNHVVSFHAVVSELSHRKPALTLRPGPPGSEAPVAAVCHMPALSRDFKIGLGDPADATAVRWEDMQALNRCSTAYGLPAGVALADKAGQQGCVWKHTRRVMVDGEPGSAAFRAQGWKLVDADGRVVAVFTGAKAFALGSMRRCGALQVNVDWGEDFEALVVVTCLALYEKERRDVTGS
jgi:hypothetical protein